MDEFELCPVGTEIKDVTRCQEASIWAASLGLTPRRDLQVGQWPGVPYQCSTQVGERTSTGQQGDDTFHFNTNSNTENSRFFSGEFVMICEAGKNNTIFYLTELLLLYIYI